MISHLIDFRLCVDHLEGISDFRVFRYRGIEPVRVFLYFESGSGIFISGSVISDRVRIFRF